MEKKPRTRYPDFLDGVPALASFINADEDAKVYKKFGYLAARNLLHLQSRLSQLEAQLAKLDKKDVGDSEQSPAIRLNAKAYDSLRSLADQWKQRLENHGGVPGAGQNEAHVALMKGAYERVIFMSR